ncbi:hypothetical protein D3C76_1019160 [compost metagenome]
MRAAPGGKAKEAAEADPWEQVGLGHADVGRGGCQLALGAADIRAALEQLAGVTHRQGLGDGRQLRRREVDGQGVRALAKQGGDAITRPHLFGLQLRHAGLDRRQAGIGTHHVKVVADPGVTQGYGDATRILLGLEVGQGDLLAQLCTAQLAIGIDQFGDQADLQLLQVGLRGVLLGIAGFQLALDAAEQVQFPGHVQAQVIAFAVDPVLGLARDLALAQVGAGTAGHGWQGVVADIVTDRPGGFQAGEGHAQFTVAVQRLADQLVEYRVVELLPPDAFEAAAVERRLGARFIGRAQLRRRGVRRLVVRAYRTGGQGQDQQARHKEFQIAVHA